MLMRVASVQFEHKNYDKAYNWEVIHNFTKKAVEAKAEMVIFPELCIQGCWGIRHASKEEMTALAETVPNGETTQLLLKWAKEYNITIGAGLVEISDEGNIHNTYVVAMPNGKWARHRKIHTFLSPFFVPGNEYTVFELPNGKKAGILICYDNNIIENGRCTALLGAEIQISPHQTGGALTPSPKCMGKISVDLWERRNEWPDAIEAEFKGNKGRGWLMRWLPARAHDNGVFLIFANGVGRDDNEVRTGNAMIIDCYGNILAETWKADDAMVVADLDFDDQPKCTGMRWRSSRRPALYSEITRITGKELDTRTARMRGIEKELDE